MNGKTLAFLAFGALIVAGGGAFLLLRHPAAPPAPAVETAPAAPAPAPPDAAQATATPPANCLLPGPPPIAPNGSTATAADMKLGHDVMQAFVNQLEAYQACRNNQADHTPGITEAQKDALITQGNNAVDEANALAAAFSAQLKAFKARQKQE
jgi:hypothetical protein